MSKSPKVVDKYKKSSFLSSNRSHAEGNYNRNESSPYQILERVKSDHVTITKPEEDRRRRTIIVEKIDGSYGFTLQSYGIHYKKESEIEMITYVDHVEYDGAAFRAGMRQGDVILSINGHNMENVDHKSLVKFVKSCDSRMRMVVLFEDCVKKVELHMRYIQLQRRLQNKIDELERLCSKEKELMSGKWKTHSLPARKKNSSSNKKTEYNSKIAVDEGLSNRPAYSTEDVQQYPTTGKSHLLITTSFPSTPHYIDQYGRSYYIQSSSTHSSNGELLVSITSSWKPNGQQQYSTTKGPHKEQDKKKHNRSSTCISRHMSKRSLNNEDEGNGGTTRSRSHHNRLCGSCISINSPQDNTSVDGYDLQEDDDCCSSSHCVPRRSRSRTSRDYRSCDKDDTGENSNIYNNRSTQVNISLGIPVVTRNGNLFRKHSSGGGRKRGGRGGGGEYSNLVNQHSLQSITSSELYPTITGNSCPSSLSTDTLYWDETSSITRKHSVKSLSTSSSYKQVKQVKSCDNLTNDNDDEERCLKSEIFQRSLSSRNVSSNCNDELNGKMNNKSLDSLIHGNTISNTSIDSDNYLDEQSTLTFVSNENGRFVPIRTDDYILNHHKHKASQTDTGKRIVNIKQTPEVTRL